MAFALGVLRWTPDAFWRATPRELLAASPAGRRAAPALTGAELARLMQAYPDG